MDSYFLRKTPRVRLVKGVVVKNGRTVRAMLRYISYFQYGDYVTPLSECVLCKSDYCEHYVHKRPGRYTKYSDVSEFQKKSVRKCDCCSTHICQHMIPVRGRNLKPELDDYL